MEVCAIESDRPGDCSITCQDCPTMEKCVLFGEEGGEFNQTACRPIPENPKAPGETCVMLGNSMSGDDDCQPGSTCVSFPYFPNSKYLEFCKDVSGVLSCADTGTHCVVVSGRPVCAPVCDPRKKDSCDYDCRAVDLKCPGCFPMTESGTFTCWFPPPEEKVSTTAVKTSSAAQPAEYRDVTRIPHAAHSIVIWISRHVPRAQRARPFSPTEPRRRGSRISALV